MQLEKYHYMPAAFSIVVVVLSVESKVFIYSPRKERGMVWKDSPAAFSLFNLVLTHCMPESI